MADFARGKIGVVLPDWYEPYRVVAYRYLESKPLSPAEQQSLLDHYDAERRIEPPDHLTQALKAWTSARAQYNAAPDPKGLEVYKSTGGFNDYTDCLAPAFITAVETLQDRARRFGATSPELQEWVRGQDAVFSTCGVGINIPPELPATANPLLRTDRAYQIAAAHFYVGPKDGYEMALQDFQAIAADKSSPWHSLASYLVARTLIRQASLTAEANQTYNPAFLAKAEVQLEAILHDPAQRSVHDDAESLLGLVRYRLHPDQRLSELGKRLGGGETDIHFGQDLVDYTWLLRRGTHPADDDLSEWLCPGCAPNRAIEKWRTTRSMPWLVAVLWELKPSDAAFSEVMEAAAKVPPTSEAYATVAYCRVRLAKASGNGELARRVLNEALAHGNSLPPSAIHLFQDEQMQAAADFETFQSHLWQNPIEYDDESGSTNPCEKDDTAECGPQFSPAAATLLNTRIPAKIFARLAQSNAFPEDLHRRMAPSAWARAALLDQPDLAKQLDEAAGGAEPALKPYLQQYSHAQTPEERQFAAVFAILHFPGLRPYVDGPVWRHTPFQDVDNYRDNWWSRSYASGLSESLGPPLISAGFPDFLSAEEKQRAAAEWGKLQALGSSSRYLPRVVINWGKKHPNDPRVPEALHLAVRAMRYGDSNELSHEAYLLLHQNYPKSEWAEQTPYWFK